MKAFRKFSLAALITFAAGLVAPSWTKAEYRAFLLSIKSPGEETPRLVKSTLDPVQYGGYYILGPQDIVTYVDTWRCSGRTSLQSICKSPKEIAAEKEEAKGPETGPEKSPERKPASN